MITGITQELQKGLQELGASAFVAGRAQTALSLQAVAYDDAVVQLFREEVDATAQKPCDVCTPGPGGFGADVFPAAHVRVTTPAQLDAVVAQLVGCDAAASCTVLSVHFSEPNGFRRTGSITIVHINNPVPSNAMYAAYSRVTAAHSIIDSASLGDAGDSDGENPCVGDSISSGAPDAFQAVLRVLLSGAGRSWVIAGIPLDGRSAAALLRTLETARNVPCRPELDTKRTLQRDMDTIRMKYESCVAVEHQAQVDATEVRAFVPGRVCG